MSMRNLEGVSNLTQLKDLEYICELASLFLKGTGGTWVERTERYRVILQKRIYEVQRKDFNSTDNV